MESYFVTESKIPMALIDDRANPPTIKLTNIEFDLIDNNESLFRPYLQYAKQYGIYVYKHIYIRYLRDYAKFIVIILPKTSEDPFETSISKISHQLRTPLNSIIGFTQLLNMSETMPPGEKQYLQVIQTSATHLLELINNLIQFKDIEQDSYHINTSPIDIVDLVRKTAAMITPSNNIKIVFDPPPNLPHFTVMADSNALRQVLLNIIQNSVEYNLPDGSVHIEIDTTTFNTQCLVKITDTGIGMTTDQIERVLMNRKHGSKKQIGLYLTRKLMEKMGGSIHMKPGRGPNGPLGLVVQILIPVGIAPISSSPTAPQIAHHHSQRILIVEDEPANIDLLDAILISRLGIDKEAILHAKNGAEAINILQSSQFAPEIALILLDYHLPDMLGSEIIPHRPSPNIPIIVITADINKFVRLDLKRRGVNEIISKPIISIESLAMTITHYLAH